jgi:predicted metal-binding protein
MSMTDLVRAALDFGFSHAGAMDPGTLVVREEVRAMCAADRCQMFGRSWTCPPGCGSLDDSRRNLARYRTGLLVQTTRELEDPYDYEGMMAADAEAKELLAGFRDDLWPSYPDLIALGNGACTICPDCTFPAAPCRHPDEAVQSMEAFGLVVSDTCQANGLAYNHGPNTITFTGCYLLEPVRHPRRRLTITDARTRPREEPQS